jgi:hypothetical protein
VQSRRKEGPREEREDWRWRSRREAGREVKGEEGSNVRMSNTPCKWICKIFNLGLVMFNSDFKFCVLSRIALEAFSMGANSWKNLVNSEKNEIFRKFQLDLEN